MYRALPMPELTVRGCAAECKMLSVISGTVVSLNVNHDGNTIYRFELREDENKESINGADSNNELNSRFIEISLPVYVELPVTKGEKIIIKTFDRESLEENVSSFVIESFGGRKLLISNTNGMVPDEEMPAGIIVRPSRQKEYVETGRFKDYCMAVIMHYSINVEADNKNVILQPGEQSIFRSQNGSDYLILSTENAKLDRSDCKNFNPSYFNYLLIDLQTSMNNDQ